MRRFHGLWLLVLACCIFRFARAADEKEAGFENIFNGKTLEGWDGDPRFWSVRDGAITGQTTPDNPTKVNTFIIWRQGVVGDCELKLEFRLRGGNSGVQYRSFEDPKQKWVVGGYQADMDAANQYTGMLYGERFRGILARPGEKVVIREGGKPQVVGSVGDPGKIREIIKQEDWNEYHIIARGFHFIHKINGVVTCEATDEDTGQRRPSGIVALQLHVGPPMMVQFRNIRLKRLASEQPGAAGQAKKKVVFVAGKRSHGYASHAHHAGCLLLARLLEEAMPDFETRVYRDGWPQDPQFLDGANALVVFSDGGRAHPVMGHLPQIEAFANTGAGIAMLHYAVEVPKGEAGDRFLEWIGGYFETYWSVNPIWKPQFAALPQHPITRGVRPFTIEDEWYFHMRFRENMQGVTPILSAVPPRSTVQRPDGEHSNNPHARAAVERGEPQHVAWAAVREGGGRGFGFTGGHWHWNWGHPDFRRIVLNAIVWIAGGEVPSGGVPDRPVTMAALEANQDYPPPAHFDREAVRKRWNLQDG